MIAEYVVSGMSCDHCVARVTTEISRLEGVSAVSIELESGLVVVTSAAPLERAAVESAVDEAGYDLAAA